MNPRLKRAAGFTLVEMLLAMSILTIGLVFVLRSLLSSSAALDEVNVRIEALQYLENRLVEAEMKNRKTFEVSTETQETVFARQPATFTIRETPIWFLEDHTGPMLEIAVDLSWLGSGQVRHSSLSTWVAQK